MSHAATPTTNSATSLHAPDSLVSGMSWMLVINLLQRGVGFARNIALCYFLSEAQLGLWGLASSFFCLAAPLAVLGLPGTFGRFVEVYRSRGQLVRFLLMSIVIALSGYLTLAFSLVFFCGISSVAIFGEPLSAWDMCLVTSALGFIILFNAITELVSGLRMPKTVSSMHAANSVAFTLLSLIGLYWFRDWRILVVAFAGATLVGIAPSVHVLLSLGRGSCQDQQPVPWSTIARRVLPFAASVWVINFLLNSFDLVDRYGLLHFSSQANLNDDVHSLVGQLHSGKLIPTLLSNFAVMLSGVVLPYLAADWECGRLDRVVSSLRTSVKFGSIFFLMMSIGALIASPFLFTWLLHGRYADGLAILPKALTVCCWMSIALFLSNYFWCAERGRLLGVLTAAGLIANVGLCFWWIPAMGLHGAMNANVVASGFLLVLMIFALKQWKIEFDASTYVVLSAPLVLMLGPVPAAFVCGAMIIAVSRTSWLLSTEEKQGIDALIVPRLQRLGWKPSTNWAR
ncbi:MAG: lipopolysaccharide biosynthesis protein [Planctomycetota bacterium]